MAEEIKKEPETGPKWKNRRRVIFATLLFCALSVGYCLYKAEDLRIYETTIIMSFLLAGSVVGSYAFAAAWEYRK